MDKIEKIIQIFVVNTELGPRVYALSNFNKIYAQKDVDVGKKGEWLELRSPLENNN